MTEETPAGNADLAPVETVRRLREVEAERDALQNELDEIKNRALDRWLRVEQNGADLVLAFQQTLSWRITKPLRAVRSAQLKRGDRSNRGPAR